MGELLNKLNAANTCHSRHPHNRYRATQDPCAEDRSSVSEAVRTALKQLQSPNMPLYVLRQWAREAPLQALGAAFLVGLILAQPSGSRYHSMPLSKSLY